MDKLRYWLKPIDALFRDFDQYVLDKTDSEKHRIFIDRQSDILFVAHLDTVQKPKFIKQTKNRIYAQGLDDRLGCMLASELSKELNVDLLLLDHEEKCQSTAQYHECKDYNWICEFDRAGSDVVTYGQDSIDFLTALEQYWKIGIGAFSDICLLKSDACTINLGIGYEFAHSKDSYVDIKTMDRQIKLFRQFYAQHKDTKFERDYSYEWDAPEYDYVNSCELCGMANAIDVYGYMICQDCFEKMISEKVL